MPSVVSAPEEPARPSLLTSGERLMSPAALAKESNLPGHRGGSRLNGSTIFRQMTKGVRVPGGEVIRLEAVKVGTRWLSSLEALVRFTERVTAAALAATDDSPTPVPAETPKQRRTAAERASREADVIFGAAHSESPKA